MTLREVNREMGRIGHRPTKIFCLKKGEGRLGLRFTAWGGATVHVAGLVGAATAAEVPSEGIIAGMKERWQGGTSS